MTEHKIYLQISDEFGETIKYPDDRTWCVDKINDDDVEYIIGTSHAELLAENEILKAMVHWWETSHEPGDLGEYEGLVIELARIRHAEEQA